MSQVIFLLIAIWLACLYPQVIVGFVLTIGLLYVCPKFTKCLSAEKPAEEKTKEKRPGFLSDYTDENGVIDWKAFTEDKIKSMLKPDHDKSPEWKKKSEELRKYMEKNRKKAEEELKQEEEEEKEREFWAKRNR